ncbi:MAG: Maltodextrin ABC transporter, permease protein MdxF, partial [uncultured Frankineae bacterium]
GPDARHRTDAGPPGAPTADRSDPHLGPAAEGPAPRDGHRARLHDAPDDAVPGPLGLPRRSSPDRRGDRRDLRHEAGTAGEVPAPGDPAAGDAGRLPSGVDGAGVAHQLRRRHAHHAGADGRADHRRLRRADARLAALQPDRRDHRLQDRRAVRLPARRSARRGRLRGHRGRAGGARGRHRRRRLRDRGRRLRAADPGGGQPGGERPRAVHGPDRGGGDPSAGHPAGVRGQLTAGVRRGRRDDHQHLDRGRLQRAAAGRPRVLRRARRQPPVRAVVAGERRSAQLRARPDRQPHQRGLPADLRVDRGLRHAQRGADLHRRAAAGRDDERPAGARPAPLPLGAHPAVRRPRLHHDPDLVELLEPRLRPHQRPHRARRELARQRHRRQDRGPDHQPVARLPLHVHRRDRRVAGHPGRHQGGGHHGRGERLLLAAQDHVPARPGDDGTAAGGHVRLQLQQLQHHLPAHRGRSVHSRQPAGRRHRHPHQLHDPAGVRAQRGAVRLRQLHRHPAVRAHRRHRRHPVPLHPRTRGRAL